MSERKCRITEFSDFVKNQNIEIGPCEVGQLVNIPLYIIERKLLKQLRRFILFIVLMCLNNFFLYQIITNEKIDFTNVTTNTLNNYATVKLKNLYRHSIKNRKVRINLFLFLVTVPTQIWNLWSLFLTFVIAFLVQKPRRVKKSNQLTKVEDVKQEENYD
ncbi:Hypothetical_protein [Hexamita inflata]|uniref:Hypothetical_protein n=1 Tax=Hexamita inflata TaxID=28002 RepID=A0ABP1HYZ6_9EUKA